jgi:hypothetical protein
MSYKANFNIGVDKKTWEPNPTIILFLQIFFIDY